MSQLVMTPVGPYQYSDSRRRFRIHSVGAHRLLVTDVTRRSAAKHGRGFLVALHDPIVVETNYSMAGWRGQQPVWTPPAILCPAPNYSGESVYVSQDQWMYLFSFLRFPTGVLVSDEPRHRRRNRKARKPIASKDRIEVREADRLRYRRSPSVSLRPGNDRL